MARDRLIWYGIAQKDPPFGDVYAVVSGGDIYRRVDHKLPAEGDAWTVACFLPASRWDRIRLPSSRWYRIRLLWWPETWLCKFLTL